MLKNWSNIALVAVSHTQKLLDELDFAFNSRLSSAFGSIHLKNGVTTEQLILEMLNINHSKRKITELKNAVETSLASLDANHRDILTKRILSKMSFREIADADCISLRTAFRRFESAQLALLRALRRQGFSEERLTIEFAEIPQLAAIAERLDGENYFVASRE